MWISCSVEKILTKEKTKNSKEKVFNNIPINLNQCQHFRKLNKPVEFNNRDKPVIEFKFFNDSVCWIFNTEEERDAEYNALLYYIKAITQSYFPIVENVECG